MTIEVRAGGLGSGLVARRDATPKVIAQEFEAVLLKEMVTSMRSTTTFGNEPQGDQMTEGAIDDALATGIAKAGGIGLAKALEGAIPDGRAPSQPVDVDSP